MKTVSTFVLVLLVASMIVGGAANSAAAQDDPSILLRIAKNAQEQIRNNISDNSSEDIKKLFNSGSVQVDALTQALEKGDIDSAKTHFLSSMKIFKEISQNLTQNETRKITVVYETNEYVSNLLKLYKYTNSLKQIAEKYQILIDFSILDSMFETARDQINSKQFDDAKTSLVKITQTIKDIEKQIREQASQHEPERAKQYAQKYVEQLDRLIENAKNRGIDAVVIQKLEDSREKLLSASNPEDIVKEIRNIISLKNQFDLTKNDISELKILQIEKILVRLSQMEQVNLEIIENIQEKLEMAKHLLSDGDLEQTNLLLGDITVQIQEIIKSLS